LPDLVRGTFFVLSRTPVTALGLNRQMHFSLESEENWHRLGDRLAPKEGWNEILEGRPGMRALIITTKMGDAAGSVFTVRVEPSAQVKFGVYFDINEHFPASTKDALKSLMDTIRERWEESQAYAAKVANHILDWVGR
jgi:hypothetical protein